MWFHTMKHQSNIHHIMKNIIMYQSTTSPFITTHLSYIMSQSIMNQSTPAMDILQFIMNQFIRHLILKFIMNQSTMSPSMFQSFQAMDMEPIKKLNQATAMESQDTKDWYQSYHTKCNQIHYNIVKAPLTN